jgi:hypothetical protein
MCRLCAVGDDIAGSTSVPVPLPVQPEVVRGRPVSKLQCRGIHVLGHIEVGVHAATKPRTVRESCSSHAAQRLARRIVLQHVAQNDVPGLVVRWPTRLGDKRQCKRDPKRRAAELRRQVAAFDKVLRAQGVDIDSDEYTPVPPQETFEREVVTQGALSPGFSFVRRLRYDMAIQSFTFSMTSKVGLDIERARGFFSGWHGMHAEASEQKDKVAKWRAFFDAWRQLAAPNILPAEARPTLDCPRFERFAQAFREPYRGYRQSGAMANFWRAAGLGYDELRNSLALAWILDRFGDHGQGSAILERLVELAGRQQPIAVTPETVRRVDYSTRTESQPLGDRESRVDIEIESPRFLIFIEVKVRAPETSDQLKRYVELARQKAAGRPSVVIFLTPDGRLPVDGELHEAIIPLSWRQVANILTAYASGERADSLTSTSRDFC